MVEAYIFINVSSGNLDNAAKHIYSLEGVQSVEAITGPYDAIVRAEANSTDELGQLVVSNIQKVDGVEKTLTCLIVELISEMAA